MMAITTATSLEEFRTIVHTQPHTIVKKKKKNSFAHIQTICKNTNSTVIHFIQFLAWAF